MNIYFNNKNMNNSRGKFIVIEGINGAGKSKLISNLLQKYKLENSTWILYKFPNRETTTGIIIDKFLKKEIQLNSIDDELKIFADNRKEFHNNIIQNLQNGINVICDRYLYSGIAYTLTKESINIINNKSYLKHSLNDIIKYDKNLIKPDLVFIIIGDFLYLRNEIKERYHDNNLFNKLLLPNFITSCVETNTNYEIVHNNYNELDITVNKIYQIIKDIKLFSNKFDII